MLNLNVTVDNIEYEKVIDILFPVIFKNKIALKSAQIAAKAVLGGKTRQEQDEFVADFINKHKSKILAYIASKTEKFNLNLEITSFDIKTK